LNPLQNKGFFLENILVRENGLQQSGLDEGRSGAETYPPPKRMPYGHA
jgi:hypothetical protein